MEHYCTSLCQKIEKHFSLGFDDNLVTVSDLHSSSHALTVYFTYCNMSFRYFESLIDGIWHFGLSIFSAVVDEYVILLYSYCE